jgi:hypothetical protein
MIALIIISFFVAAFSVQVFMRRARRHARIYGADMPQRFHKGRRPAARSTSSTATTAWPAAVAMICCLALFYVALAVGDRQLAGVMVVLAGATPASCCGTTRAADLRRRRRRLPLGRA